MPIIKMLIENPSMKKMTQKICQMAPKEDRNTSGIKFRISIFPSLRRAICSTWRSVTNHSLFKTKFSSSLTAKIGSKGIEATSRWSGHLCKRSRKNYLRLRTIRRVKMIVRCLWGEGKAEWALYNRLSLIISTRKASSAISCLSMSTWNQKQISSKKQRLCR